MGKRPSVDDPLFHQVITLSELSLELLLTLNPAILRPSIWPMLSWRRSTLSIRIFLSFFSTIKIFSSPFDNFLGCLLISFVETIFIFLSFTLRTRKVLSALLYYKLYYKNQHKSTHFSKKCKTSFHNILNTHLIFKNSTHLPNHPYYKTHFPSQQ